MKQTTLLIISFLIGILTVIAISTVPAMNRNRGPIPVPMTPAPTSQGACSHYHTIVIDSCEYIEAFNRLAHKGNCRFCAERHRKGLCVSDK